MINKETFRKTESKLYNYFGKDKKINSINRKINLLKKQIDDIESKLRNVNISIPEESKSMIYEERVQTSSDGASYAEKTLMRITDKLIAEKARKEEEITDLEEELRNIEADNIIMDENIGYLSEDDRKFLKIKYGDPSGEKQKDWQIGFKLEISQSSVTRTRQRLVENVARWEQWYGRY
jgi:hypothetical protein